MIRHLHIEPGTDLIVGDRRRLSRSEASAWLVLCNDSSTHLMHLLVENKYLTEPLDFKHYFETRPASQGLKRMLKGKSKEMCA